jgi:GNAT superfamily N-acetyltransferase
VPITSDREDLAGFPGSGRSAGLYAQGSDARDLYLLISRPTPPFDLVAAAGQENKTILSDARAVGPHEDLPLCATAVLRTGAQMTLRPLRSDEGDRLADYFDALSARTRDRYGPHAFDRATAHALCAGLATDDVLRLVGVLAPDTSRGEARLIAYFLLKRGVHDKDAKRYQALGIPLDAATDATLAPSVADSYQDSGVGSLMMGHTLAVARQIGRRRVVLWGGVQATNERAVHFYTKFGFRKVGEFLTGRNNFDMILDLVNDGRE